MEYPEPYKPTVTTGNDLHPTILLESGGVFPRNIENIINKAYYPTGEIGEWPVNPDTGERLPREKKR